MTGRNIGEILGLGPVIPVLTLNNEVEARLIASALWTGGVCAVEVTLRTPTALKCIRAMADIGGLCVGAGTVLTPQDFDAALDVGAQFIVAPGLTQTLAKHAHATGAPFLPGVSTPSDVMAALDHGWSHVKFFPAEASGGIAALRALSGPFGQVRFCPTGGITLATAPGWLALPNVVCVGGSWLVPAGVPDLEAVEAAARTAVGLRTERR